MGAGIAQRFRQQLLTREDLRQRQASLGAESDTSSIYFSVGSHFEDGERDIEDSVLVKDGSIDETDNTCRRRRRGNYMPPPQILMWLEKTESHTVEDADVTDQPWPFSESVSSTLYHYITSIIILLYNIVISCSFSWCPTVYNTQC